MSCPQNTPFCFILHNGMIIDVRKPNEFYQLVTPSLGSMFLKLNTHPHQRRITPSHVQYLASLMENKEWQNDRRDGGVFFTTEGWLANGQHTLHALIKYGKPVVLRLVLGINPDHFKYFDGHLKRAMEWRASLIDDSAANRKAVAITTFFIMQSSPTHAVSVGEIEEAFSRRRASLEWVCGHKTKDRGVDRIPILAALSEMWEKCPDKAESFYMTLHSIDGPIQQARVLRDFILRNSMVGGGAARSFFYARAVCACKAHIEDRLVKNIVASRW